jgi:hypothetical protein
MLGHFPGALVLYVVLEKRSLQAENIGPVTKTNETG